MLTQLTPIEFTRSTSSGRTKPAILVCEDASGQEVEVVAKFSDSCDQGVTNLAREAVAACLAGDLGLPIPRPYLIGIPASWAMSVTDVQQRAAIQASAAVAFGSTFVGPQFNAWNGGTLLQPSMVQKALAILVFDAIVQNTDRRAENPNCLVLGDDLRIFDHELTFAHKLIICWRPPWHVGGLQPFMTPGFHIFRSKLRGKPLEFASIRASWASLTDARIAGYEASLPVEWAAAGADVAGALTLIRDARDRIDECLAEVQRVLT